MTEPSQTEDLYIRELRVSNVKRVVAVTIRPTGELVVLGGKNGDGKSSTLDSIMYALGGERVICREPLRRGAEKGSIDLDLNEFKVRRTFTKSGGGSIVVTTKDGAKYPKPQMLLDGFTSLISFDPLAFSTMDAGKQAEALRAVIGIDLRAHDAHRDLVFAERTRVNRDVKDSTARLAAVPLIPGVPEAEVSTAAILAEREAAHQRNQIAENEAEAINDANASLRQHAADDAEEVEIARREYVSRKRSLEEAETELARWTQIVADRRVLVSNQKTEGERLFEIAAASKMKADAAVDVVAKTESLDGFGPRLRDVEAINSKVRSNATRAKSAQALAERVAEADALTAQIEELDAKRAKTISEAKMPVAGLGFDPAGFVTMNGLPLDQASDAERIRISVGIGLAMHPRLKMLMIRNASLLDASGMELVRQMAKDAGAQFWLERVGKDELTTVEIVDGSYGQTEEPSDGEAAK